MNEAKNAEYEKKLDILAKAERIAIKNILLKCKEFGLTKDEVIKLWKSFCKYREVYRTILFTIFDETFDETFEKIAEKGKEKCQKRRRLTELLGLRAILSIYKKSKK